MSLSFHPVRSSRLPGTERLSSLEDLPRPRSRRPDRSQTPPFSIRSQPLLFQMPVTPKFSSAPPFAPILVASQCHILEPTRDGFAFVTVLSMTSSEESDKV